MTPVIVCDRLTKRYGRTTVLRELNLEIGPGVTGLLGPNGAGKSTLISTLLGQTPATAGRAAVLGLDVRRRLGDIRRRVGFMPENDCMIPGMSGTGYVYYTARLAGLGHADAMQRTHEVLDYVELDEARYRPSEQYSTGMKQRLKLAQSIVHDPDLLLLDEPTNGMDPLGRQAMLELIRDLARAGISVLLSSHLLPDVERVCESVVILGGGEVLAMGALADMHTPHATLYAVDAAGDVQAFEAALQAQGVRVLPAVDGTAQIELPGPNEQRRVFAAAAASKATIRGLHPRRSTLEETFLAALQKQADAQRQSGQAA